MWPRGAVRRLGVYRSRLLRALEARATTFMVLIPQLCHAQHSSRALAFCNYFHMNTNSTSCHSSAVRVRHIHASNRPTHLRVLRLYRNMRSLSWIELLLACLSADRDAHCSVILTALRSGTRHSLVHRSAPDVLLRLSITPTVPSEVGFPDGAHNAIAPPPGIRSSAKEPANVFGDRDRSLPGNE